MKKNEGTVVHDVVLVVLTLLDAQHAKLELRTRLQLRGEIIMTATIEIVQSAHFKARFQKYTKWT